MSGILEITEDRLVRSVNGIDRTFVFFNAYDRAELLRDELRQRQAAWQSRKAKVMENLKFADVTGMEAFQQLEAFDNEYPEDMTEQDWIEFVKNPINEPTIIEKSLAKTYPTDAKEIAKSVAWRLEDKAAVCGLSVVNKVEAPDPNVPTPETTYSTPAGTISTGPKDAPGSPTSTPA